MNNTIKLLVGAIAVLWGAREASNQKTISVLENEISMCRNVNKEMLSLLNEMNKANEDIAESINKLGTNLE